jgi:hypothetical protein
LFKGDDRILVRDTNDFSIFSKTPIEPFAGNRIVMQSVDHQFVDMFPIFPTIDLKNEKIYRSYEKTTIGLKLKVDSYNLHTFFHINDNTLDPEVNGSRLIAFTFASAYAKARQLEILKVIYFSFFHCFT